MVRKQKTIGKRKWERGRDGGVMKEREMVGRKEGRESVREREGSFSGKVSRSTETGREK